VDTQDGQVLLRVIVVGNLVDVVVSPAGGQKRPLVSEGFRSRWVHSRLFPAEARPRWRGSVLELRLDFI